MGQKISSFPFFTYDQLADADFFPLVDESASPDVNIRSSLLEVNKKYADVRKVTLSTADSGATYTGTVNLSLPSLSTDFLYICYVPTTNTTTTTTINIAGLGAKTVKKLGQAIQVGDLKASSYITLIYDGTNFEILDREIQATKYQNYVFIDGTYGSDTTGEIGNPFRPFATIAFVVLNGYHTNRTTIVAPGSQTLTGTVISSTSDWYFAPGTTITVPSTGGFHAGSASTINIKGYGAFTGSASATVFKCDNSNATINVECHSMTVAYRGCFIGNTGGGSTINFRAQSKVLTSGASVDSLVYIEYTSGGSSTQTINFSSPIISGMSLFYNYNDGSSAKNYMTINADQIFITGGTDLYFSGSTAGITDITINCPEIRVQVTGHLNNSLILSNGATAANTASRFTLNGNIYNESFIGSIVGGDGAGNVTGIYTINGNIISTATSQNALIHIIGASGNANITINGIVELGAGNYPVVSLVAGTSSASFNLYGALYNKHNDTSAHGIAITHTGYLGKCHIRPTAVIETTNASAESVYSSGATNIQSYPGSTANKAVNAGVTQQVSTITVDTNIKAY